MRVCECMVFNRVPGGPILSQIGRKLGDVLADRKKSSLHAIVLEYGQNLRRILVGAVVKGQSDLRQAWIAVRNERWRTRDGNGRDACTAAAGPLICCLPESNEMFLLLACFPRRIGCSMPCNAQNYVSACMILRSIYFTPENLSRILKRKMKALAHENVVFMIGSVAPEEHPGGTGKALPS